MAQRQGLFNRTLQLAFVMDDIAQSAEADAIRSQNAEPREAHRKSQSANICCTQSTLATVNKAYAFCWTPCNTTPLRQATPTILLG
jgi:hypothetical protein